VGGIGTALVDGLWDLQQLVGSAALELFNEYEDLVARDGNKILPMDGTIHPLTAQVLSYVKVWHTCPRRARQGGGRWRGVEEGVSRGVGGWRGMWRVCVEGAGWGGGGGGGAGWGVEGGGGGAGGSWSAKCRVS
jgi:hypothetical protein